MPTTTSGYRTAVRLGAALAPVLGKFNPKLRAGVLARQDAGDRLLDWARWNRDPARPLAWFHAASVGEGLQARSVLLQFRKLQPGCQIVYTHFSPSAEALARGIEADAVDYLPYDLPGPMDRLLGELDPDLLVFAKLDVWPELATRAALSGCDVVIVAATVSPGSGRLRWPARQFLEPGYQAITRAAAIARQDALRLERLGVARDRIAVLGDPRFDSVMDRVGGVRDDDPLLRWGQGAPTLVAGSTWPADEEVLLRAFGRLRQRRPDARLIVVPHEPTAEHLAGFDRAARAAGLPVPIRLSAADGLAPLMVVDRVGVLATLYGAGRMAYVGGGYGHAGLHSVLEPAAWGLPVAFGPRWHNSRDAALLLEVGAAIALPGVRRGSRALAEQWAGWIEDDQRRETQGRRGRELVEQNLGASARSAAMLAELISKRLLRTSRHAAQPGRR
ncbi:MAG TPA: glycosyltransferase N-terminal domain-containing protein [Gemmatimonadales bacterium]|jgi:3-deoxy-D-manno-octulosonic-acid transferase|nr:glycosyltransferase N-terminal domain-containing protein [Gemmatimonadales bacterium]